MPVIDAFPRDALFGVLVAHEPGSAPNIIRAVFAHLCNGLPAYAHGLVVIIANKPGIAVSTLAFFSLPGKLGARVV